MQGEEPRGRAAHATAFASLAAILALFFLPHLRGARFTGWDARDLALANFTYFSDCLKSGIIPLWNPFVLGGDYFFNLNNAFLFNPLTAPFEMLAWLINPALVFEWFIFFGCLLAAAGTYRAALLARCRPWIAAWSGCAYALLLCVPILGQPSFLYSLAAYPWLFWTILSTREETSGFRLFTRFLWAGLIMANGYPWLNLCGVFGGALYYASHARRLRPDSRLTEQARVVLIAGTAMAATWVVLLLPGWLNLRGNYAMLADSFASMEPRLRSLAVRPEPGILSVITGMDGAMVRRELARFCLALADPQGGPVKYILWSDGVGITLFSLLAFGALREKWLSRHWFFLAVMAASVIYSSGLAWPYVSRIPILSANRWIRLGIYFAAASAIAIAAQDLARRPEKSSLKAWKCAAVAAVIVGFGAVLISQERWTSLFAYAASLCAAALALFPGFGPRAARLGLLLSLSLIVARAWIVHGATPSNNLANAVSPMFKARVTAPVYDGTKRKTGASEIYEYDDLSWVVRKEPISHGYDNQSDPLYWFVKNKPFMREIAFLTNRVRNAAAQTLPLSEPQARQYMSLIAPDGRPALVEEPGLADLPASGKNAINSVHMSPNSITLNCALREPAYLILNEHRHDGWLAYANGGLRPIFKANRIFQGVRLEPGDSSIEFRFFSPLALAAVLPYLAALAAVLRYAILLIGARRRLALLSAR